MKILPIVALLALAVPCAAQDDESLVDETSETRTSARHYETAEENRVPAPQAVDSTTGAPSAVSVPSGLGLPGISRGLGERPLARSASSASGGSGPGRSAGMPPAKKIPAPEPGLVASAMSFPNGGFESGSSGWASSPYNIGAFAAISDPSKARTGRGLLVWEDPTGASRENLEKHPYNPMFEPLMGSNHLEVFFSPYPVILEPGVTYTATVHYKPVVVGKGHWLSVTVGVNYYRRPPSASKAEGAPKVDGGHWYQNSPSMTSDSQWHASTVQFRKDDTYDDAYAAQLYISVQTIYYANTASRIYFDDFTVTKHSRPAQ